MALFAGFKSWWMRFAHRLGRIQTVILLTLVYTLVLGPTALMLRALRRGDLLALGSKSGNSFALPKQPVPTDLQRCERQF